MRLVGWLITCLGIYVLGFGVFVAILPAPRADIPVSVEGLVVFTGGSGRVDAARSVLGDGFHGPLLISGVHPDVRPHELIPPELMVEQTSDWLTLDYDARTTRENVLNTARWANDNHITHLALVTNRFHALRCRVLFVVLAPELEVAVMPVADKASWETLFREYNKLLLAPLLM